MYKPGMILRQRMGGQPSSIASYWYIQLVERLPHSAYEIKYNTYDRHGGNNMGWVHKTFGNYDHKWRSDGWVAETHLDEEYEPIGRLMELIMFGINNVQAEARS